MTGSNPHSPFSFTFGVRTSAPDEDEDEQRPGAPSTPREYRILVVSELVASADHSLDEHRQVHPYRISDTGAGALLRQLAPSLLLDVPDPLVPGKQVRLSLRFEAFSGFRPGSLAKNVEPLRELAAAQRAARLGSTAKLRQVLRPEWTEAIERRAPRPSAAAQPAGDDASVRLGEPPARAASEPAPARLDALLAQVALPGPSDEQALPEADTRQAPAAGSQLHPAASSTESLLQQARSDLLDSIVSHPEFRRLEAAWRGLALASDYARGNRLLALEVLSAGVDDVRSAVEAAQALHPTADLGWDVLLVDHPIRSDSAGLARLRDWATLGAQLSIPVLCHLAPEALLGCLRHSALSTSSRVASATFPELLPLEVASGSDDARWLLLSANRLVARPAHRTELADPEMPFNERLAAPLTMSPSYGIIALISRSLAERGHPLSTTGPHFGQLTGLGTHELEEPPHHCALSTEWLTTTEAQSEWARFGVALWGSVTNRDRTLLSDSPMLHRERTAGIPHAPTTSLADQLLTGRSVRLAQHHAAARDTVVAIAARLRDDLSRLFPNAPPVGPQITVEAIDGSQLDVEIRPHRYGDTRIESIRFRVPLSARSSGPSGESP